VLSHYETSLAAVFDQIRPFAISPQAQARVDAKVEITASAQHYLLVQHKIVGQGDH